MKKRNVTFNEKVEIIKEYLDANNTKANNRGALDINTVYNGYPIGQWANFIRYNVKKGLSNKSPEFIEELEDMGLLDARMEHAKDRANRLIDFLERYPRLWYDKKNFEKNVDAITRDLEERQRIVDLHNQAEEDYAEIRQIITRQNSNHKTLVEKKDRIPEELVQKLIEANVGRALGYSEKNKKDKETMINNYDVNEAVADKILRTYGTIDELSRQYIEALINNSVEKNIPPYFLKSLKFVTDFDLRAPGFVVSENQGYVKLAKYLTGKNSIIYDGKSLKEILDKLIEKVAINGNKSNAVAGREVEVVRYIFGLDGSENKNYSEIARNLGLSSSRVQQIASHALTKLKIHSEVLNDAIYDVNYENQKYFIKKFFEYNSVWWTSKENPDFIQYTQPLQEEIIYGRILKYMDQYYSKYIIDEKVRNAEKRIKNNDYFESFIGKDRDDDIKFINDSMQDASSVLLKISEEIMNNDLLTEQGKQRLQDRLSLSKKYAHLQLYKKIDISYPNSERTAVENYYANVYSMINKAFSDNISSKTVTLNILKERVDEISLKNRKQLMDKLDFICAMDNPERIGNQDIKVLKNTGEGITDRIIEILRDEGIFTLNDLIKFSAREQKFIDIRIKGLGVMGRHKIENALEKLDLTLEDTTTSEIDHKKNDFILHKRVENNVPKIVHQLSVLKESIGNMYLNEHDENIILRRISAIEERIDMNLFEDGKKDYILEEIKSLDRIVTMQSKISKIRLSPRTKRLLNLSGISTFSDLCEKTSEEIRAIPNFGEVCYREILGVMGSLGIHFKGGKVPILRNEYIENNNIKISKTIVKEIKSMINEFNFDEETREELSLLLRSKFMQINGIKTPKQNKPSKESSTEISNTLSNELNEKISKVRKIHKLDETAMKILDKKRDEIAKILREINNSKENENVSKKMDHDEL